MPGITYADLSAFALTLPGVETSTSYGTPALKVRGKLMVRLWEDESTAVVKTTWEDRERLLATCPEQYFLTDHYRQHPWVLLRLGSTDKALMKTTIQAAWRLVAPKSLLDK